MVDEEVEQTKNPATESGVFATMRLSVKKEPDKEDDTFSSAGILFGQLFALLETQVSRGLDFAIVVGGWPPHSDTLESVVSVRPRMSLQSAYNYCTVRGSDKGRGFEATKWQRRNMS